MPARDLAYVCDHYSVPAHEGRRVTVDGQPGVIVGADRSGARLLVQFDDGYCLPAHPTWRVDYEPGDDR
jgi:hypothetical protein